MHFLLILFETKGATPSSSSINARHKSCHIRRAHSAVINTYDLQKIWGPCGILDWSFEKEKKRKRRDRVGLRYEF